MKVVHIELGQSLYGGAKQASLLATQQQKKGLDIFMLCPKDSMLAMHNKDLSLIEVPYAGSLDFLARRRIKKIINKIDPDIIHCHSRRGAEYLGCLGSKKTKTVLTRRVLGSEPRWLLRKNLTAFDQLVAISNAIQADLSECLGRDKKEIPIIPSGADLQNIGTRNKEVGFIKKKVIKLLLVSQLIERKQCHIALMAVERLIRRGEMVTLDCYGEGPMKKQLQRYINENGLKETIVIHDYSLSLEDRMYEYDMLIHTANNEGLGAIIIEAMSRGLPVIASNIIGISDLVRDSDTALSYEKGDADMLANKIIKLWSTPELARQINKNAFNHIANNFDIKINERKYFELYGDLL